MGSLIWSIILGTLTAAFKTFARVKDAIFGSREENLEEQVAEQTEKRIEAESKASGIEKKAEAEERIRKMNEILERASKRKDWKAYSGEADK